MQPDFLLFAQHGWSDNGNDIGQLAKAIVDDNSKVVAPSLGLINTYWRIENLIQQVENLALQKITIYPETPLKIIGHSMGGLIWLEVLNRHPEWWQKVHSVVVIGSPIGGANLARTIDPFGWGIGIARDLGKNRRKIAEKIAQNIPTLSIASDLGNGSDGMVPLDATKFAYAKFLCLENIPHARLKRHLALVPIVREFWSNPQIISPQTDLTTRVIRYLRDIPGMTDADRSSIERSQTRITLPDNTTIRTAKNIAGVDSVFVLDSQKNCLYAGYVGWLHSSRLKTSLDELKQELL